MNQDIKPKQSWWMPALIIFTRISAWIVFPVIAALFIGKRLDEYFQTGQIMFIICMVLSFVVSSIAIIKISKSYIKNLEQEAKQKNVNNA
jgi:F0F1-type ATP synthase assembly protein I